MARADDVTVLTGATGFVGSLVLERLLARGAPVAALVRADDDAGARRRLEQLALRTWGDADVVADVEVLAADVERARLGLAPEAYDALAARAGAVVHCAASVRFDLALDNAHAINVDGTERMVELAEHARTRGAAGRFVHVSTAYVHGRARGLAREAGPVEEPAFRNTYERTKHRAERVVERLEGAAIVRPSIVVGDSRTGWTSSFNVVYVPLRALVTGVLEVVPAPADAILDLVPVDHVVDAVCGLLDDPSIAGVVQAVSGRLAPTMEEFARLAYAHAGRPMTPCVPAAAEQIGIYAPYVDVWARFEFARAAGLGVRPVPIEQLVPLLLDHAAAAAWGRRHVLRPSPLLSSTAV
ncbi:SDR family oxidoreductase [Conexibacter woesei]|uniref:Male sterility domain protein n=1 Tax=Conexibacter woesei (strain DSM 14684 / CCUG 47730 / CIP 108061 / JCM 11494 / NBRC 100937 / ID131577) TaxID=469383 RepID=D3FDV1_CONWI|nr:SDR family oxidoreductase [Conexibacter woesei]ADB51567.1 Male sterility domain protein [Conexibacter woesei DSM 14684]